MIKKKKNRKGGEEEIKGGERVEIKTAILLKSDN